MRRSSLPASVLLLALLAIAPPAIAAPRPFNNAASVARNLKARVVEMAKNSWKDARALVAPHRSSLSVRIESDQRQAGWLVETVTPEKIESVTRLSERKAFQDNPERWQRVNADVTAVINTVLSSSRKSVIVKLDPTRSYNGALVFEVRHGSSVNLEALRSAVQRVEYKALETPQVEAESKKVFLRFQIEHPEE